VFFCPFSSVFKTYRVIGNLCAQCLDQVGKVIKTPGEVNVLVSIAGYRWTLNAHCLRHAPGETLTPGSDSNIALPLLGGLSLLLDSLGPSILIHAAARGDISTVQTFLERNPHQVNTVEQGKTAVHVAVEESRLKVLEVILKFKPDLSIMDGDGDSPLHTCAFLNATEAAPILLEAGADVNAKNAKRSVTPIMIAGAVGHYELLEIMAAHHSADVNIQDRQGQTALHHVLSSQRTRAIPILLSAGANLTLLNSNLFTPLMEAAGHGSLPGVEDIVRQRPDLIDWQILADGITPLQLAGIKNRLFVVRHLALSGCDLNRKSGQHLRTALQATAIEGYVAVIECLVGFGCDVNLKDSDGNTALHIVFVNKCAQPLSDYTPQMNKVHEELSRLPLESVPRYLTLGCFLIQEGADPCARNNLGQTPAQTCPSDTRDILLNYVNKSNRGEFHGSLRRDRTSAASKTDNKPSVPNSSPRIISDSATISQQQSITAGSGGSRASGSRLGSGHGSIMDAQHQELGGGGGGGAGRLSQRERDRLRLQETKRKEVVTSESEEPRIPSAEEREQIRKHRQAYFASQDAKKKATASSSLTTRQEGRVTENQHTVKVVDTKRGEQQAASLGSPDTVESRHQTSKTRPQPSKTTPEATKLAEDEAKGSASKPTLRSSGANSVEDDSGKEQKRRENENSEQVQRKTVGTEERKKEKRQSQQKYSGSVSTVDTGKGTSFQPVTQPQFNAKDRASASVPCFVCERPANARLAPCGHNVACKTCARRAKRCPICKVLVTGVS
jgi:ankyrin repeat protein